MTAKTSTKATKARPPATTPEKRTVDPHELVLSPTIQGAVAIKSWSGFAGEVDLAELLDGLRDRVKKVQDGDMAPIEAMLFSQAMALETIFTSLSRRAASNDTLKPFQANMTLALKAQAQCRATLEALAEIKNPRPMAFVKQANFSGGHQQVNNGTQPAQQAGSAQGWGGESAQPHALETTLSPTQRLFPAGADAQTVENAPQSV